MTKIYFKKIRAVLLLLTLLPIFAFAQVDLLQTTSNDITKAGFGCLNVSGGRSYSVENNQARLYNLTALGYSKFEVTKVSFALHSFERGSATNFPVTVKVYASTGGTAQANLTLKGQEVVNITESMVGQIVGVSLTTPAVVTSPQMLIVVSAPNGDATSTSFFIGANEVGQTAPAYYQSSECGNNGPEFKSYLEMNPARPDTHVILFPTGNPTSVCPTGNIALNTQAQVNQFKIDYPNCTTITSLGIGVASGIADITDLTPLANITTVVGDFAIASTSLTNLNGLSSLTSVGGLMAIQNNASLTTLNGLNNLTSIGGILGIVHNTQLTDIIALKNISPATIEEIAILDNPALAVCNLPNFCTYLANPANTHPRSISGNLANCLDEAAVLAACSASQCPTGNVILTTQAEVNQFKIDYPNCTEISGNLDIGNMNIQSDIINLNGLENITNVTGFVRINHNHNLTNIDALSNLKSIGNYLTIASNKILANVDGLSSLKSVANNLYIQHNESLTNVNGLNSLESIGGELNFNTNKLLSSIGGLSSLKSINGDLRITANAMLTNLNGISNALTSIGGRLFITNNAKLIDINGLSNLKSIGGTGVLEILGNTVLADISGVKNISSGIKDLRIRNNPALAVCNLPNFCTFLANPAGTHPRNISGNLANCLDEAAVVAACITSQCPTGNVTLNTQEQVDQFLVDYPSCTQITGNLFVGVSSGTSDITDLSPLNNITKITGDFNIERSALTTINGLNNLTNVDGYVYIGLNPNLTQINNLSSLTTVGVSLNIRDNPVLTELSGLSTLANVGSFLRIRNNPVLTNIAGLSDLASIGGFLEIVNNASLKNLNALSDLTSIGGSIQITDNKVLNNISALQHINPATITGGLTIQNNPALAVCNLPNFCTYLANPAGTHPRTISGNLAECINEAAVIAACNAPQCPIGNIILATQAQVDQFKIDYPNCTQINGFLHIDELGGTNITNLNGLSDIASVSGDLIIRNNQFLQNLDGLNNLNSVGGLTSITSNSVLANINGLSGLNSIGGFLAVQKNPLLTDLNGLNNLTTVGGDIFISNNTTLSDILGLKNTAFAPLDGYGLTIANNPALAVCNLPNFCAYLSNPASTHPRDIWGNLAECVNEAAVLSACNSTLPVTLTGFTAIANNNYALLQWQTASEQNNKGFAVWRSGDDGVFVKIGEVAPAMRTDGQSSAYTFTDKQPFLNGNNYYKLVQIDNDGKENELGVRTVTFNLQFSTLNLYPNPTTNQVTVNWGNSSVYLLKLIDLSGKVLQTIQPKQASASITISLANYPAGTYLIRIEGKNGVETRKVIKL